MFTNVKNWFKGLFGKKLAQIEAAEKAQITEKALESAGWEKYHQMMSTVSTSLEANIEKVVASSSVNDQITDAVTQEAPKPKKKAATKKAPTMKAEKPAKPAKTKSPKTSK